MKIMNIMLSRILGGIEQSFLDYEQIINLSGNRPVNIISTNAKISSQIKCFEVVPNFFQFDPITLWKLRRLIKKHQPKFILAHGSRAIKLIKFAKLGLNIKLIGISHNYKYEPLVSCDHVIAITEHMKNFLINKGMQEEKVTVIANSIKIDREYKTSRAHEVLTIGSMGRFVKKKGFDVLLHAFKLLKDQGIRFKGVIGGQGEEEDNLKALCTKLGLDDSVTFLGWVKDKEEFFSQIDIFCLPSSHEPFGIILLEAMLHSKPIITTNSEGPLEIIEDGKTGIFFDIGDEQGLFDAVIKLMSAPKLRATIAKNAYLRVVENYGINSASEKFRELLSKLS
jgi:glycosyltransferase involved in cell wall biosynthesis